MRTEKTLAAIAFAAILMKIFHLPFSSVLLMLGLGSLSLIYLFFSFYFLCDKELKRQNVVLSILWGAFMAVIPLGILFKLMWWPGSWSLLISGIVPAIFFLSLTFYFRRNAPEYLTTYYNNLTKRTILLCSLNLVFLLTPGQVFIKMIYWSNPGLEKLMLQRLNDPNNIEYQRQLDSIYNRSDSLNQTK
ncbi:MAG: hypothetical protein JWO03_4126 [Bacteroidetes bacterium]|nr:hypothetical protein [Bacteroidota bacterium]